MAYGTINADVIQSSVTGVSLGAGNATVFKNRIINGDMRIDQRNAGASVTITNTSSTTYTLDRWYTYASVASKISIQQNAGSVTPPVGFINYLGVNSLSAYTVSGLESFQISQIIEGLNVADLGWGTANAKTVTLSAWVYSSLTGTFGGVLQNSSNNRTYPFNYSIPTANTWTQISITIAGDTSGTWLTTNGTGIIVKFGLGVGSTLSGTAGSWSSGNYISATGAVSVVGTNGATFYITGVQLEVGSSATGFEYVNYGTQLAMCQRYYWRMSGTDGLPSIGAGFTQSTTEARIDVRSPVQMRTTPTVGFSNVYVLAANTSGIAITAISANYGGSLGAMINVQCASGLSGGALGTLLVVNSGPYTYYFDASAEL